MRDFAHEEAALLSDARHLIYKGFRAADATEQLFTPLYLPFGKSAPIPKPKVYRETQRTGVKGFTMYYAAACPYLEFSGSGDE